MTKGCWTYQSICTYNLNIITGLLKKYKNFITKLLNI